MSDVVRFYRDASSESQHIELELARRQIDFRTIWDDGLGRLLPAIEFRQALFEGAPTIEVYFFGQLDLAPEIKNVPGSGR
jgi:hypothetical protein